MHVSMLIFSHLFLFQSNNNLQNVLKNNTSILRPPAATEVRSGQGSRVRAHCMLLNPTAERKLLQILIAAFLCIRPLTETIINIGTIIVESTHTYMTVSS